MAHWRVFDEWRWKDRIERVLLGVVDQPTAEEAKLYVAMQRYPVDIRPDSESLRTSLMRRLVAEPEASSCAS
jgi:hypothetical protein